MQVMALRVRARTHTTKAVTNRMFRTLPPHVAAEHRRPEQRPPGSPTQGMASRRHTRTGEVPMVEDQADSHGRSPRAASFRGAINGSTMTWRIGTAATGWRSAKPSGEVDRHRRPTSEGRPPWSGMTQVERHRERRDDRDGLLHDDGGPVTRPRTAWIARVPRPSGPSRGVGLVRLGHAGGSIGRPTATVRARTMVGCRSGPDRRFRFD